MAKTTIAEFFSGIDNFHRCPPQEDGSVTVIIRQSHAFTEWKEEFIIKLKKELMLKIRNIEMCIEDPDAISTFCISILSESW